MNSFNFTVIIRFSTVGFMRPIRQNRNWIQPHFLEFFFNWKYRDLPVFDASFFTPTFSFKVSREIGKTFSDSYDAFGIPEIGFQKCIIILMQTSAIHCFSNFLFLLFALIKGKRQNIVHHFWSLTKKEWMYYSI